MYIDLCISYIQVGPKFRAKHNILEVLGILNTLAVRVDANICRCWNVTDVIYVFIVIHVIHERYS